MTHKIIAKDAFVEFYVKDGTPYMAITTSRMQKQTFLLTNAFEYLYSQIQAYNLQNGENSEDSESKD